MSRRRAASRDASVMRGDGAGKHKRPRLEAQAEDLDSGSEHRGAIQTLAAIEGGLICGVCMELYKQPCAYVSRA